MPPKLPKSVTRIPIPLYGGTLWFAQSIDDVSICASLIGEELSAPGWYGIAYPISSYRGGRVLLVGVQQGSVDVLAHEMAHATFKILDYAGVSVSADDDEAFCYLLQHLMAEAVPHLKA